VESGLGPVEVLVVNHGLARRARYEDVDADAFDRTLAVNLRAPFLPAQRALVGMRQRGFGRILFVSSGRPILPTGTDRASSFGSPGRADLCVALLRNAYVTNHVYSIDGGMHPR
jgi:NAD(P)-dependent dehydrogenase (short-subunit alcohol dehydrogenase family)